MGEREVPEDPQGNPEAHDPLRVGHTTTGDPDDDLSGGLEMGDEEIGQRDNLITNENPARPGMSFSSNRLSRMERQEQNGQSETAPGKGKIAEGVFLACQTACETDQHQDQYTARNDKHAASAHQRFAHNVPGHITRHQPPFRLGLAPPELLDTERDKVGVSHREGECVDHPER